MRAAMTGSFLCEGILFTVLYFSFSSSLFFFMALKLGRTCLCCDRYAPLESRKSQLWPKFPSLVFLVYSLLAGDLQLKVV